MHLWAKLTSFISNLREGFYIMLLLAPVYSNSERINLSRRYGRQVIWGIAYTSSHHLIPCSYKVEFSSKIGFNKKILMNWSLIKSLHIKYPSIVSSQCWPYPFFIVFCFVCLFISFLSSHLSGCLISWVSNNIMENQKQINWKVKM